MLVEIATQLDQLRFDTDDFFTNVHSSILLYIIYINYTISFLLFEPIYNFSTNLLTNALIYKKTVTEATVFYIILFTKAHRRPGGA